MTTVVGREVFIIDVDERGTPKIRVLEGAFEALNESARKAGTGVDGFDDSLKGATRSANSAQDGIKRTGLSLLQLDAGLNIAARGFGLLKSGLNALKSPVSVALNTQSAINAIRTLSDQIGPELEAQLLALPARIGQSTQQTLKSAYDALSAGVREENLVGFLQSAGDLARVGQTGLVDTAKVLQTTFEAFGKTGQTLQSVNDILFETARVGKTTLGELAPAFPLVATSAAQYGVALEQATAATAALTKTAPSTGQAVTQLASLIRSFAKPSQQARKALDRLGVSYGIGALKARGLTGVLDDLQRATGGNVEAFGTIFERSESNNALLSLLANGQENYRNALIRTSSASGSVAKGLGIMNEGAAKAFKEFDALKEKVLRDIGEQILPSVVEGMRALSEWFERDGAAFVKDAGVALGTLGDAFVVLVKVGAGALSILTSIGEAIGEAAAQDYLTISNGIDAISNSFDRLTSVVSGPTDVVLELTSQFAVVEQTSSALIDTFADLQTSIINGIGFDALVADVASGLTVIGSTATDQFSTLVDSVTSGDTAMQEFVIALSRVGDEAAATAAPIFQVAEAIDGLFDAQVRASAARAARIARPRALRSGGGRGRDRNAAGDFRAELRIASLQTEVERKLAQLAQQRVASLRKARELGVESGAVNQAFDQKLLDTLTAIQDKAARERVSIQRAGEDAQVGAIADASVRTLELLRLRHSRQRAVAIDSGLQIAAITALQERELGDLVREQTQARLSESRAIARQQAEFHADEFESRRLLLEIEREETLSTLAEHGGSLIDATLQFEARRTQIAREQSEARIRTLQAEVDSAGTLAQNLIGLGDAIFGADSKQSALRIALEGSVLAARATSAGAESVIEFARGNVFKGAALAAAAAAAGIDAIKLGAQAAGLGGGGSSAAPSGGGPVAPEPRQRVQAQQQPANITINAGFVVGEGGMREFARIIAPGAASHVNGANGYIGEAAS